MRNNLQKQIFKLYETAGYCEAKWCDERYFLSLKKDASQTVYMELFDSYNQEVNLQSKQILLEDLMHTSGAWLNKTTHDKENYHQELTKLLENIFMHMVPFEVDKKAPKLERTSKV